MAGVDVVIEEKNVVVNRQKVCPFLLRVFVSKSGFHFKIADYNKGSTPLNELQIYTWKDATLHELTQLVKEVLPETRRNGTKFNFAFVYPDLRAPVYRMREIGSTTTGVKGPDDAKTLGDCRFTIGDYLDIAIVNPEPWNSGGRKGYNNNHRQKPY
ncbi:histone deacetylase complex subunit SAP18 [Aethina tumida]|uniref:histone deacetylase complex subunit SAP18 n=1 Tax=Aethina tumida TaxID=116153 RepID=UPI00096B49AA|nr:histone deacetylase complex subunit SAP18 [Aethina tumida]